MSILICRVRLSCVTGNQRIVNALCAGHDRAVMIGHLDADCLALISNNAPAGFQSRVPLGLGVALVR